MSKYPGIKKRLVGRRPKVKMRFTNVSTGKKSVSFLTTTMQEEPMDESTDDNPLAPQLQPPPSPPPPPDDNIDETQAQGTTRYAFYKQREVTGWRDIHEKLLSTGTDLSAPMSFFCIICNQQQSTSIYRCQDCGPTATFCLECLEKNHKNSLHQPEVWMNTSTCFQPFMDPKACLRRRDGHKCITGSSPRLVKVYNDSGRPRVLDVYFCRCEPEPCQLLRFGLWAATTDSPETAFSVSLLESLVSFSLACHVSVEGFCTALRWKNNLASYEADSLYRALVGAPIAEFRHYHYKKSTLQHICADLDDGTHCPACPKRDGEQIVLLDGNFGLVRKASSGTSHAAPHHGNRMFADDAKVEGFLDKYSDASKPNEDCSDFQAGSKIRSKNKQKKLDVTGVFGATCRHEIPLQFINMTQGERLGYPVFLIKELLKQAQDNNLQLRVIYDIACVLKSHLKGNALENHLKFAIPSFHIYGHKTHCQILYSTRRQEGYGLTDGEGMERLWSYLRPFFRTTKEMTPSHRLDLLTDAILHYARRKSTDMELSICHRMEKAEKMYAQADKELEEIISQAPVPVSEEDILRWDKEEKETIRQHKRRPTSTAGPRKCEKEYVLKLTEFHALREEVANAEDESLSDLAASYSVLKGMKEKLKTMEAKHKLGRRWKPSDPKYQRILKQVDEEARTQVLGKARTQAWELTYLLGLKVKYPDGQAIAVKLSRQLKTISAKLEKTCTEYNNIQWAPQQTKFPSTITSAEARQPQWDVYTNLDLTFTVQEGIPHSVQRNAIDTLNKKLRAKEEQQMLREEMVEVMKHLLQECTIAEQALKESQELGEQATLISHLINLEKRLKCATYCFDNYLTEMPDIPDVYLTRTSTSAPERFKPLDIELDEPGSEEDMYGDDL